MKVQFTLSIGFPSALRSEVVEFEDFTLDEEIEDYYQEWCNGFFDGGWKVVEKRKAED
jgi:hypothetical protein